VILNSESNKVISGQRLLEASREKKKHELGQAKELTYMAT